MKKIKNNYKDTKLNTNSCKTDTVCQNEEFSSICLRTGALLSYNACFT